MSIDNQTLKNIIAQANPLDAARRFRSSGSCGNEGVFRICQLLKSTGMKREDATQALHQWFDHWKTYLPDDENWRNLYFEDVEVHADEVWPKIKYSMKNQLETAKENAQVRFAQGEYFPRLSGYGGEPVRLLSLVCYELAQMEDPWWVSERDAAVIMGMERNDKGRDRARTVLKVLERKHLIEKVKTGNEFRANRYKFGHHIPQRSQKMPENPEDAR